MVGGGTSEVSKGDADLLAGLNPFAKRFGGDGSAQSAMDGGLFVG